MTQDVLSNLRFLFVNLKDAADEHRLHDTEFALGRASMADEVADIIKLFMEEYDE